MFNKSEAPSIEDVRQAAFRMMDDFGFNSMYIDIDGWSSYAQGHLRENPNAHFKSVTMLLEDPAAAGDVARVIETDDRMDCEIPYTDHSNYSSGYTVRIFRMKNGGFITVDGFSASGLTRNLTTVRLIDDEDELKKFFPDVMIPEDDRRLDTAFEFNMNLARLQLAVQDKSPSLGISLSSGHPSEVELVAAIHTLAAYECEIIQSDDYELYIRGTAIGYTGDHRFSNRFAFVHGDEGSYIRALVSAAQNLESKQRSK